MEELESDRLACLRSRLRCLVWSLFVLLAAFLFNVMTRSRAACATSELMCCTSFISLRTPIATAICASAPMLRKWCCESFARAAVTNFTTWSDGKDAFAMARTKRSSANLDSSRGYVDRLCSSAYPVVLAYMHNRM